MSHASWLPEGFLDRGRGARGETDFGVGVLLVGLALDDVPALVAVRDGRPLPFLAALTSIVSVFWATRIRFSRLEINSGKGTTSKL